MTRRSQSLRTAFFHRCFLVAWLGTCCLFPSAALADEPKPPAPNPAEPVNYIEWINETLSAGVEDDAAAAYLNAYKSLSPFEGDWGDAVFGPWSDNQALSEWLDANREALDEFRAATHRSDCFFPLGYGKELMEPEKRDLMDRSLNDGLVTGVVQPHLSKHRDLAKALIAGGYRDWDSHRSARLEENCLVVLRSVPHLANRCPSLIQRLVANACAALAYEGLLNDLKLADDRGASAVRVLPKLKAADPPRQPFAAMLRLERVVSWDNLQRTSQPLHTREFRARWEWWKGTTTLALKGIRQARQEEADAVKKKIVDSLEPLLPPLADASARKRVLESVETLLAELDEDTSNEEILGAFESLFREVDAAIQASIGGPFERALRDFNDCWDASDAWCAKPYAKVAERAKELRQTAENHDNPLLRLLFPADIWRARELDERFRASRRATHLVFHLFAHYHKVGAFPEKLDELDAPDLKQLRIDPFSGRDFVYKREGDSFTLYSVASDLKDDGGKHGKWKKHGECKKDDFVFWPRQD